MCPGSRVWQTGVVSVTGPAAAEAEFLVPGLSPHLAASVKAQLTLLFQRPLGL